MVVYVEDSPASSNTEFEKLMDTFHDTFESRKKEYQPFLLTSININKTTGVYFLQQKPMRNNANSIDHTIIKSTRFEIFLAATLALVDAWDSAKPIQHDRKSK